MTKGLIKYFNVIIMYLSEYVLLLFIANIIQGYQIKAGSPCSVNMPINHVDK